MHCVRHIGGGHTRNKRVGLAVKVGEIDVAVESTNTDRQQRMKVAGATQ